MTLSLQLCLTQECDTWVGDTTNPVCVCLVYGVICPSVLGMDASPLYPITKLHSWISFFPFYL